MSFRGTMAYIKISPFLKLIGIKQYILYILFQKILRINSHVPWPVHFTSKIISPEKILLHGKTRYIGWSPCCYIQALNGIEIGENVRVGPGVKLISANHNMCNYNTHDKDNPIKIGNDCWICANAVILPGVELAQHTIVAAGAVVTKNFLVGDCIIGGVPAEVIRRIGKYGED